MGFGGKPNLACSEFDVPLICPQRALVVQWIERQTSNLNVGGSSPSGRTTYTIPFEPDFRKKPKATGSKVRTGSG